MDDPEVIDSFKGFYEDIIKPNGTMFFLTFMALLIGILSILFLPADNPIEQAAEKVIENQTGIKIDLTATC